MFLWLKKSIAGNEGEAIVTFDPPSEEEGDDLNEWVLLSTQDRHYDTIAQELDKHAKIYEKQNDYRSARVARDLAKHLRDRALENVLVN
jgi:hypothetical protein